MSVYTSMHMCCRSSSRQDGDCLRRSSIHPSLIFLVSTASFWSICMAWAHAHSSILVLPLPLLIINLDPYISQLISNAVCLCPILVNTGLLSINESVPDVVIGWRA